MNLCNVCKKYFNEPHDCTTTREEKLHRVWIREEPWHEEALKNLEVVATDIASNYARRGSHWIEYVSIETHESLLREARAKVWEEASNATHQYPHYVEFRRFCRSKAVEARKE